MFWLQNGSVQPISVRLQGLIRFYSYISGQSEGLCRGAFDRFFMCHISCSTNPTAPASVCEMAN